MQGWARHAVMLGLSGSTVCYVNWVYKVNLQRLKAPWNIPRVKVISYKFITREGEHTCCSLNCLVKWFTSAQYLAASASLEPNRLLHHVNRIMSPFYTSAYLVMRQEWKVLFCHKFNLCCESAVWWRNIACFKKRHNMWQLSLGRYLSKNGLKMAKLGLVQ